MNLNIFACLLRLALTLICFIYIYGTGENVPIKITLIGMAIFLGLAILYSIFFTWPQVIMALALSQKKRVTNAARNIEELRMDGFMQHLKREVGAWYSVLKSENIVAENYIGFILFT